MRPSGERRSGTGVFSSGPVGGLVRSLVFRRGLKIAWDLGSELRMGVWGKGWGSSGWFPVHPIPSPQERFQVKNPPTAYIQKLKSYLETGGVSRKVATDWMSNLGVYVSPFFSVPSPRTLQARQLE